MPVEINPDLLLSAPQVASMLEGISGDRVKYMCQQGMIPCRKTSEGPRAHWRIRFGDLDKVVAMDLQLKKANRKRGGMQEKLDALEARITWLERAFDEYTAPEVASSSTSR